MNKRLVGGLAAVGVALALVAVAVFAAGDSSDRGDGGDGPRALPVLGAAGDGSADAESAATTTPTEPNEVVVEGELPELTGEADAWRVGLGLDLDRVASLGEALGLDGEVEETADGWSVTDGDRWLNVVGEPGLPWSYSNARAVLTDAGVASAPVEKTPPSTLPPSDAPSTTIVCEMPECPVGMSCTQVCPEDGVSTGPTTTVVEPERPADLPSQEDAEAIARRLFEAAGVDLSRAEARTEDWFTSWGVSAAPVVDGLPTIGMESSVSVGAGAAIEYANGWLATPERGDRYPLIGTTAALEDLTVDAPAMGAPECEACPEPQPLVVTGVRLGLQLVHAYGLEEAWLVPSYLFAVGPEPSYDIPVFAIDDAYLTEPPVAELEVDPVPVETTTVEPDAGSCATATSATNPGVDPPDDPLEVELCVSSPAVAGKEATFTLTAVDRDAYVGECHPSLTFGEEESQGCIADCIAASEPVPEEPGELRQTLTNVYEAAGDYTVEITVVSGPCGTGPYANEVTLELPITVIP